LNPEKIYAIIRKNKKVHDFSYKVYDFIIPIYVSIFKHFSPKFALERSIRRIAKLSRDKKLPDISFIKGEPLVIFRDYKFVYTPESEGGGCISALTSPGEAFLSQVILSILRKDSVFLDVGANIGYFSVLSASKITQGKIFAFEPVPKTLSYLRRNIILNQLSARVYPQGAAVGNKDGFVFVTTNMHGRNRITPFRKKNCMKVRALTLDTFCREMNIQRVELIKADVEGAELLVLKGGEKLISRNKPFLVLEAQENWMRRFGSNPQELFGFLHKQGYSYKLILQDKLTEGTNYRDISADLKKTNNILFFHNKRKEFLINLR